MEALSSIRSWLESIHPLAPHVAIALVVWLAVWAVRKWAPHTWQKLPTSVQSLPALLLAEALSVASSADATQAMVNAVLGVLAGVLAVGGHHVLKDLPGPYVGGEWPAAGSEKP